MHGDVDDPLRSDAPGPDFLRRISRRGKGGMPDEQVNPAGDPLVFQPLDLAQNPFYFGVVFHIMNGDMDFVRAL